MNRCFVVCGCGICSCGLFEMKLLYVMRLRLRVWLF